MSLANTLPPELLCRFMILVSDDPRSLLSAARVCHSWSDPAQRALHTHVQLLGPRTAEGWLSSPARLRYQIRSMLVVRAVGQADESWVTRVLLACDGLEELVIVSETRTVAAFMGYSSLSRLKSLTIELPDWPLSPPPDLISFQLESLSLVRIGVPVRMGTTLRSLIGALLPASSQLTSLALAVAFYPNGFQNASIYDSIAESFSHTSSTLAHLAIELRAFPSPLLPLLPACTALTSLTIDFNMRSTSADQRNLLELGTALPATVLQLTLTGFVRVHSDLECILAFLRLPALGKLQQVRLPSVGVWAVVGTANPLCDELLGECRARGIGLCLRHEWI